MERLFEEAFLKPGKDYYEDLIVHLRDPAEASAYLNAALEAGDKRAFLLALRNVLEARGGMTRISRHAKINRVSLYKMLSSNGNPGFENVLRLLQTAGIRLQVVPKPANGFEIKSKRKSKSVRHR